MSQLYSYQYHINLSLHSSSSTKQIKIKRNQQREYKNIKHIWQILKSIQISKYFNHVQNTILK